MCVLQERIGVREFLLGELRSNDGLQREEHGDDDEDIHAHVV